MRGIILAGGTGSRLAPCSSIVNKHLLPLYDRSMLSWAAETLRANGIPDNKITVVSTPLGASMIYRYLRFKTMVQKDPGGIPQALACADDGSSESVAVILGDNVFLPPPDFGSPDVAENSAICYLRSVEDPREFGVAEFDQDIRIKRVVEKPSEPPSDMVVTGLYLFAPDVFDRIKSLKASARGELEVADLLNTYATEKRLFYRSVAGFWGDAGTFEGMYRCATACRKFVRGET